MSISLVGLASNVSRQVRPRLTVSKHRRTIRTPAYPGHVPLNWFETAFLAVGFGMMALRDPKRGGVYNFLSLQASQI